MFNTTAQGKFVAIYSYGVQYTHYLYLVESHKLSTYSCVTFVYKTSAKCRRLIRVIILYVRYIEDSMFTTAVDTPLRPSPP